MASKTTNCIVRVEIEKETEYFVKIVGSDCKDAKESEYQFFTDTFTEAKDRLLAIKQQKLDYIERQKELILQSIEEIKNLKPEDSGA